MVPIFFLLAIVATGNVEPTIVAAIVVSIIYALANALFDFGIKWDHKGRKSRGEYRIWTQDEDDDEWRLNTGNVDELITLHRDRRRICYIERSVRVKEGNPYSLGLSLATGALAIDIASVMGGEGLTLYTGYALAINSVILLMIAMFVSSNQNADPNEIGYLRFTAGVAIFFGLIAMFISFLLGLGSGSPA